MSRTEFAQSQNHLRNRSSTSRFGYQSQVQSSNSTPFLEGGSGGGEKQRFSTPYDVSEEDRSKFRSFKFPRKTSILSGHSGSGYMRVDLSTPSLSDFPCDTSSSNAIPFQNQHYDHGLPTPPPSGSDHHHLLDESLKSVTHLARSPAVPQPLLPQRFKKQYRHLNDSYSTAKNASVDLRNMEETFLGIVLARRRTGAGVGNQ
ncbi:hypothetical protein D9757_000951 [Collybiopsis confluens]|uniref:Uncharacterized protein n=1 Tax=Collybiopsis confluens TaxID=2823264 RepID=A0A8H5I074_9AGAR|nr:hypothetical protein D9757_000951 [Collybiopsis confluens]